MIEKSEGWIEGKDGGDTCYICGKWKDEILQLGTNEDKFSMYFRVCRDCLEEALKEHNGGEK